MSKTTWLPSDGFYDAPEVAMVIAHGAGAPADSEYMKQLVMMLDGVGISSIRFEFPYMQQRRFDGRKRPPGRQPGLLDSFAQALKRARDELPQDCFVMAGGKSMGGRMASLLALPANISESSESSFNSNRLRSNLMDAVVCYSYPFHPPGKLDCWRTEHLAYINCPLLIVQGTRDPFGKPAELVTQSAALANCELRWLEGGNHDFQPFARQPETQSDLIRQAAQLTRQFADKIIAER
ncbi:MAG: alpha/beta family hydrolase [Marinobacter sp.]